MKTRALHDLAALRDELRRRREEAAAEARRREAEMREAERQRQLFAHSVGPVNALSTHDSALPERARPEPLPRQRDADERAALRASLSDEIDVEALLLTDDGLSFRRPAVGLDVVSKLRGGHWAIQAQLDLHGMRRDQARDAVAAFIRTTRRRGERCVRVVHGKGHGSPGRKPVLKSKVQRWLAQCDDVIAFTQASGPQGGSGALIVLLS